MPSSAPEPVDRRCAAPLVCTEGNRRTLEFTPGDIQSEMLLSHPDRLVLDYTRAMMGFALFVPRPRHILMVGLGGGSLAKFCHRHFPRTRITVLEVRADVIALRGQFQVPPDDGRLQVVHADAADYLQRTVDAPDVILVDGFDTSGLPSALTSATFYASCRRVLRPGGILVANIFTYDPAYVTALQRLRAAFDGHLAWFEGVAGNNRILFAGQPDGARDASPRALRLLAWLRRADGRRGAGAAWSNRLLARLLVAWLARGR